MANSPGGLPVERGGTHNAGFPVPGLPVNGCRAGEEESKEPKGLKASGIEGPSR